MDIRGMLAIAIGVGTLFIGIGLYMLFNTNEPVVKNTDVKNEYSAPVTNNISQAKTTPPICVITYVGGSCWTSQPRNIVKCPNLQTLQPSVDIRGNEASIYVPATSSQGVKVQTSSNNKFQLEKGDKFEIKSQGQVHFSNDHPCVNPEGLANWYDPIADSQFNQNIGGLEFSIGSLSDNRYFAGSYYSGVASESGVPVFRVVERLLGYQDNNSGGFTVVITKIK